MYFGNDFFVNTSRLYKFSISAFLAVFLVFFGSSALAAKQPKVAVLDPEGSLLASKAFERFQNQIKKDFASDEAKIKDIQDELVALQQRIAKDGAIMSDEEKRRLAQEAVSKREDGQFAAKKLQDKIQQRQQEWLREMSPRLNKAVKDVVERDKYDLVVQRGAVVFVGTAFDISKKVTETLNKNK